MKCRSSFFGIATLNEHLLASTFFFSLNISSKGLYSHKIMSPVANLKPLESGPFLFLIWFSYSTSWLNL